MITATYFGERVQVVDALDGIATVRSLNPAHTWASWTHGGWAFDSETNAPVRMLTDIDPGEDAAEQARRTLGEDEQTTTSCNECPWDQDASMCEVCQERAL
jgi:hypothetical protein